MELALAVVEHMEPNLIGELYDFLSCSDVSTAVRAVDLCVGWQKEHDAPPYQHFRTFVLSCQLPKNEDCKFHEEKC